MADIKFLNNISLENLQLNNAKLQVVATDPTLAGAKGGLFTTLLIMQLSSIMELALITGLL